MMNIYNKNYKINMDVPVYVVSIFKTVLHGEGLVELHEIVQLYSGCYYWSNIIIIILLWHFPLVIFNSMLLD